MILTQGARANPSSELDRRLTWTSPTTQQPRTQRAGELTADDLRARLGVGNERLAAVLASCSLLVDGAAVRDGSTPIPAGARVDVLPPFAGG